MPGTDTTDLERKTAAAPEAGLIAADDDTGVVEALVSITGIEDQVKDTILPGAYAKTLTARIPKGIFGHDWSKWVARTEEVKELMPGSPALPKTQRNGQPWPPEAGALYVKCRFNMATDDGARAYHNVKFFADECEWSIGYQVPKGGAVKTANGGRRIKQLDCFEYSPVLFGAAALTSTLTVKARGGDTAAAAGAAAGEVVTDDGSGTPGSDPVTEEADSYDPDIAALHQEAMAEMDSAADGWDAVMGAAEIDPGEEDLNGTIDAAESGSGKGSKLILDGDVTLEFKDDDGASPGGTTPPDGLQGKVAGQEASPKDVAATDRLRHWYTHGGGAAEINWGVPGDFMRCVAIAGKHMDPAKAKGFCQLRHHDATGAYAGHAPGEAAAHAAAGKKTAPGGQVIQPAQQFLAGDGEDEAKGGGYDPALETGPLGGGADPGGDGEGLEDKQAAPPDLPGSLEQHLEQVQDAVCGVLGGKQATAGGMPRYMVVVNGTWPDHVIATRFDMTGGGADDGDAFQVPYSTAADGSVQLGDTEPVTLTVTAETAGTKTLAEDELSGVPVLVEYVTGHIRRGLQSKAGRVLSEINIKLLRGAVDQLISVLTNAGIPVDVPGTPADDQDINSGAAGTDPAYLPDSTAPAAQVMTGKTLLEPGLVARAYAVTAAAHSPGDD